MADLDAGATGTMPSALIPDVLGRSSASTSPAGATRRRRPLRALPAADQLREPPVRAARDQGADGGGGDHRAATRPATLRRRCTPRRAPACSSWPGGWIRSCCAGGSRGREGMFDPPPMPPPRRGEGVPLAWLIGQPGKATTCSRGSALRSAAGRGGRGERSVLPPHPQNGVSHSSGISRPKPGASLGTSQPSFGQRLAGEAPALAPGGRRGRCRRRTRTRARPASRS